MDRAECKKHNNYGESGVKWDFIHALKFLKLHFVSFLPGGNDTGMGKRLTLYRGYSCSKERHRSPRPLTGSSVTGYTRRPQQQPQTEWSQEQLTQFVQQRSQESQQTAFCHQECCLYSDHWKTRPYLVRAANRHLYKYPASLLLWEKGPQWVKSK